MSVGHYENFPVASFLVPARERAAVVAIYRFARAADDLADEGNAPPQARLAALSFSSAAESSRTRPSRGSVLEEDLRGIVIVPAEELMTGKVLKFAELVDIRITYA